MPIDPKYLPYFKNVAAKGARQGEETLTQWFRRVCSFGITRPVLAKKAIIIIDAIGLELKELDRQSPL